VRSRPARIAGIMLVVALAGCGGDDDATSATTQPSTTTPSTTSAPAPTSSAGSGDVQPPDATVTTGLPAEVTAEMRPVEVQGASLPELGDSDIQSDPARGMTAPIVIGEDFDNKPVRIDPAADGPTLAVFLAHWCPHCNREVPRINQLRDDGKFPPGLKIIGVSTGINPNSVNWPPSKWFEDMDWTYPVIADGVDMAKQTFIAADAYGLDAFPLMVLMGGDGKVLARWSGEVEPDELIQRIQDNLPSST
jgi:cytochrome c biogenesis protein CcmG, thiol:disulfide interchange protein DsbE